MLFLEEKVFIDALHGIHFTHFAVWNKEYLAETTFVNNFAYLKVFKCDDFSLQAWFADETLTGSLVLICFFLVQLLGRVELCQVRLLQNDEIVEKLVLHSFYPVITLTTIFIPLHDKRLTPGQQIILSWHASHSIGQISLRRQIVF